MAHAPETGSVVGSVDKGAGPNTAASGVGITQGGVPPSGANLAGGSGERSAGGVTDLIVTVGPGIIVKCRDGDEEPSRECGSLQFDPVAVPVLKGLAQCGPGKAVPGHLSMGFDVDFRRRKARPMLGRTTTLTPDSAQAY